MENRRRKEDRIRDKETIQREDAREKIRWKNSTEDRVERWN